ncbi:MAG: diguanylate cyclase, partial [Myxococcales bacterium]|nr:diguanylate cyclase [Myxococcales bacterium]
MLSPTAAQADDARGVTLVIKDLSGQDRLRDLATLAETDPLTGVANRRGLAARGRVALERARAAGQPVSVVQLDADHFKR